MRILSLVQSNSGSQTERTSELHEVVSKMMRKCDGYVHLAVFNKSQYGRKEI